MKTTQPFWIKERHNPQTGVYYVGCGQLSKTAARKQEKALYGDNFMHEYPSEKALQRQAGRTTQERSDGTVKTTPPKEQNHSARAPRLPENLLQELLDNDGELKTGPIIPIGVYRLANDLMATRNDYTILLAQNEMLRKALAMALPELAYLERQGYQVISAGVARAALEQTEGE